MGCRGDRGLKSCKQKKLPTSKEKTQQVTYEYIKGKNYILYQAILKVPLTKDVLQAFLEKKNLSLQTGFLTSHKRLHTSYLVLFSQSLFLNWPNLTIVTSAVPHFRRCLRSQAFQRVPRVFRYYQREIITVKCNVILVKTNNDSRNRAPFPVSVDFLAPFKSCYLTSSSSRQ